MKQSVPRKSVELLAPGGDGDSCKAAILAGADAVYCGLPMFNARQRAENITLDNLKELVVLAHQHNCRIYLTLNVVLLEHEFSQIFDLVQSAGAIGIDAIIVQDLGLLFFLKTHFPAIPVHASTQMTTHNTGQITFLARLNVTQVNLSRELSLDEIKKLCNFGNHLNITTEVFVHGAYCVSFSGQCYMSSALCGHSGNRGECVQPCRRTYFVPGNSHTALPFNLKDNSAFASAGDLIAAGVGSFKIEGRIKNATYVYTTVIAWRKQIDSCLTNNEVSSSDPSLKTVFNRQFSDGYLKGRIGADMFIDSSRDQSLILLSTITNFHADKKTLTLEQDPDIPADSQVLVYTPDFKFICTGIIEQKISRANYLFRIEHELKGKIVGGQMLYGLSENGIRDELTRRIGQLTCQKKPVSISVRGSEGHPLEATFVAGGKSVTVGTTTSLTKARSLSLTESVIADKLGMLGNTEFELDTINCAELEPGLFLPLRELNELRRNGITALDEENPHVTIRRSMPIAQKVSAPVHHARCACLVSSEKDLQLCSMKDPVFLFEIPAAPGTRTGRIEGIFSDYPHLVPWFGPILIGDDYTEATAFLDKINPPCIITDNTGIGMAATERKIPWIAGPMLNCTNSYSLECLSRYEHCKGAFLSNELGKEQLRDISAPTLSGTQPFELWFSIFTPLLLMNTRQCIIRNCGQCGKVMIDKSCITDCSRKTVVTDPNDNPFFIEKRPGHYNQVFNGRHYFNPDIVRDLRGRFSTFVVDLRDIPTRTNVRASKEVLLKNFLAYFNNEPDAGTRLRSLITTTTAGQYTRGL